MTVRAILFLLWTPFDDLPVLPLLFILHVSDDTDVHIPCSAFFCRSAVWVPNGDCSFHDMFLPAIDGWYSDWLIVSWYADIGWLTLLLSVTVVTATIATVDRSSPADISEQYPVRSVPYPLPITTGTLPDLPDLFSRSSLIVRYNFCSLFNFGVYFLFVFDAIPYSRHTC